MDTNSNQNVYDLICTRLVPELQDHNGCVYSVIPISFNRFFAPFDFTRIPTDFVEAIVRRVRQVSLESLESLEYQSSGAAGLGPLIVDLYLCGRIVRPLVTALLEVENVYVRVNCIADFTEFEQRRNFASCMLISLDNVHMYANSLNIDVNFDDLKASIQTILNESSVPPHNLFVNYPEIKLS